MKQLLISSKDASLLARTMEFLDASIPEQYECYETIRKILNQFDKRKPMKFFKRGGQYPNNDK